MNQDSKKGKIHEPLVNEEEELEPLQNLHKQLRLPIITVH